MKIKLIRTAALLVAHIAAAIAAPLATTTAVHTKPDAASPAITSLKAGTEPTPAVSARINPPPGWMAVELPGPFEAYVENRDLNKSLDVKPGANIRLAPKADAPVLTVAEKGDKISITGLRGKWTQISLQKPLVGFINVGAGSSTVAATATKPMSTPAPATNTNRPAPAPLAPAPVTPSVYGSAGAGQAAPMVNLGDGGATTLPRQFAGRFVSTRRPLAPRRPFDYALNDEAGKRYAYLDISKLLLTEQIEKYTDRNVVVFGAARATADGKDIVITVETLQLK
jgi:hypothetical protein